MLEDKNEDFAGSNSVLMAWLPSRLFSSECCCSWFVEDCHCCSIVSCILTWSDLTESWCSEIWRNSARTWEHIEILHHMELLFDDTALCWCTFGFLVDIGEQWLSAFLKRSWNLRDYLDYCCYAEFGLFLFTPSLSYFSDLRSLSDTKEHKLQVQTKSN